MITHYTIYGERCSGTNYLEELMTINFNLELTWKFGWKHFFGFNNLNNSDNTLFIGIVRDPFDWTNSLFKTQHHLPKNFKNIKSYLNDKYYSIDNNNKIIKEDVNIYTKENYKNIMELRHTKLHFLIQDMPKKVKNYILIRYEDLLFDFENTMNKIKDKGLTINNIIEYPINIKYYKKNKSKEFNPDKK